MLLLFALMQHFVGGMLVLVLAGIAHSAGIIPIAMILLRNSDVKFRGRIMGIRMLSIYGNLPGLLIFAPLVARFGYPITASAYCLFGIACTLLIAVHWRTQLWRRSAPANTR